MAIDKQQLLREHPDIKDFLDLKPTLWLNPGALANDQIWQHERFTIEDIEAADADLHRYAPCLKRSSPRRLRPTESLNHPWSWPTRWVRSWLKRRTLAATCW